MYLCLLFFSGPIHICSRGKANTEMQIYVCKIFEDEEKWRSVCDGTDIKCKCTTSVCVCVLTTEERKLIFKSPLLDSSSFLCFCHCDLSLALVGDTHLSFTYFSIWRCARVQNRNSCPCNGKDYAASFKCRTKYLRYLINNHFITWVCRQQTTNADCNGTSKRGSVCFPIGGSPHWLLEDVYNNYTHKETAVRLGRLSPWLHEQNNTILWSICSTYKDSLFFLVPNCMPEHSTTSTQASSQPTKWKRYKARGNCCPFKRKKFSQVTLHCILQV